MSNLIAEFNSTPWAIESTAYKSLVSSLKSQHVENLPQVKEAAAKRPNIKPTSGKVGIVPIMGTIVNRSGGLMEFLGMATSSDMISAQMDELMRNDNVSAIVARIDSNGGMVKGTPEGAEKIFNYRGQGKKLIAVADGDMNSAALWYGSAFDQVYVTQSGSAGSVGVIWEHIDDTEFMESNGFKSEVVSYGEYKAESWGPMTDSLRDRMQEMVNETGEQFVATLARNRGVATKHVKENFGKGRVLTPREAVAANMVDGIASFDQVINQLMGTTPQSPNAMRRRRLALAEKI